MQIFSCAHGKASLAQSNMEIIQCCNLMKAIEEEQYPELCKLLLEKREDHYDPNMGLQSQNALAHMRGHTPFTFACHLGKETAVHLLADYAIIDLSNPAGRTPLACAALGGWKDIVYFLLCRGATPTKGTSGGVSMETLLTQNRKADMIPIVNQTISDEDREYANETVKAVRAEYGLDGDAEQENELLAWAWNGEQI